MQSSTAVFLRSVVMLGVLVALPAYALLGTSLPDKLLPTLRRLAMQDEQPPGGDAQRPPSLAPSLAPSLVNAGVS